MKTFKAPKTILKHPAVLNVVAGEDQGSDYKYWVFLKDGEKFTNGRMAGCSGGAGFNSVMTFQWSMEDYKVEK